MPEISLLPEPVDGSISLVEEYKTLPDEQVVRSRVQKADYALGDASPGQEEINRSFWLGMEDMVREQAALAEQIRRRDEWLQASADIVRSAAAEGRPLSTTEMAYVLDRPEEFAISERTAMEERYSRRLIQDTLKSDYGQFPEVEERARSIVTKQQIALRVFEDIESRYKDTSWASWGADFAKQLIPFYSWWKKTDRIRDVKTSSILTGANLAEQIRGLYFLPAEEFEARLKEAVESLAQDNMIEAREFAEAAVHYSVSDEVWDNIFFGMDAADVASLGATALAGKALSSPGKVAKTLRDVADEARNPLMTSVDRKVLAGDVAEAAEDGVRDRLAEVGLLDSPNVAGTPQGSVPLEPLNNPVKTSFGLVDPENFTRSAGSLSVERQRRLLEVLSENKEILKSSMNDVTVVRIDDAAAQKGFELAEQEFRRINFRLEDGIIEVRPVRQSVEAFGGVDHIEVTIGKKDALPFKSDTQALNYAKNIYRLPEGSFEVVQKGNGFYLQMMKHIDESNPQVLDIRLSTDNQAPVNLQNRFLSWLRNPDDLRSREASAWAKVATYGGNATLAKMSEVAKSIGTLGKNEIDRLGTIMNEARFKKRQVIDPKTGKAEWVSGKFYDTVAELEQAYTKRGYQLPTDNEIKAYFSFRQLMDYDHAVRNISVYRDKARLGINQKSIGWIHVDEEGRKIYKQTDFFEGRIIDSLPNRSGEPYTIGWFNGKTGKTSFLTSDSVGSYGKWKEIEELLSQDYKIIQVANPNDPVLKDVINTKGDVVQYLIVRDVKEKPLSMNQVPYNEGGHWIYPETGRYIKQARTHKTGLGRRVYDGDVTAHWVANTKDADRFAQAYETARQMILRNDPGLDAFAQRNLPYSGDELKKLFDEGTFDLNSPFVVTDHGQRVSDIVKLSDLYGEPIVDSGRSEHSILARLNTQYAQERGERLTSIKNTGTEANPVFKLTGAPIMDSLDALGRSAAQLAKSRFFDDYKHRVVEDSITQFSDILDAPIQALRADPMRYLHEPVFKKGADANKVAAFKSQRRSILYLLGQDDFDMGTMKWLRQKVVNSVGVNGKIIDPVWWTSRTDPSTVMRSSVFDMKLGLFNVVQFPLQAQAVLHAAAIDGNPIRAAQANFAYWAMRIRGLAQGNSGVQSGVSKALSKALGVRQDVLDEMYDVFQKTGMDVMEGEYARLDDYLNPKQLLGAGGFKKGLDAGRVFFKEGNLWHRGTAFATAFLRYRAENPTKKLDAQEIRKIVERADLYYVNMSRASNNPVLASGPISVPAQFFTFHKNLQEQLLGKRLTGAEKARVISMYSALYGVPVGVGLYAATLWPVSESIRQFALESGLDIDDNIVLKTLMNGSASVAAGLLTDTDYNWSERFGPGGLTWLRDLIEGENFEVVGGASGSSIAATLERMEPFWYSIASVFSDTGFYPVTKDDFIDLAREVSSLNNIAKAYYAVQSGQYMTKSGRVIMEGDFGAADAALMGALGLTPQEVSDTYLMLRSMKQEDEAKAQLTKLLTQNFTRGTKASVEGNPKLAEQFYRRAYILGQAAGLTPLEMADIRKKIIKDHQPLLEKVDRKFMLRDPDKRFQEYFDRRTRGE